jgi:hypothetical protein
MSASITCSCGKELRIFAHHAGKPMRCPACGVLLTIPSAPAAEGGAAGAGAAAATGAGLTGRRALWPWVAGAAVVLLLGAGLAWWLLGGAGGPEPSDLDFVPPDAAGFVRGRVAAIWQVEDARKMIEQARKVKPSEDPVAWLENNTGLRPDDLDRLTAVFADPDKHEVWFAVRTVKPYDRDALLGRLRDVGKEHYEGTPYFAGETKDGKVLGVYFAGKHVLVAGPEPGLRRCLKFRAGPRGSGPLDEALRRAAGDDHVVGAYNPTPEQRERLAGRVPKLIKPVYTPLSEARFATFWLNFDDSSQAEAKLTFADKAKAQQGRKAAQGGVRLAKLGLALARFRLPAGTDEKALDRLDKALDALKIEQQETDVTVRAESKGAALAAGAAVLLPMLRGK